jgi:hypothetical protein
MALTWDCCWRRGLDRFGRLASGLAPLGRQVTPHSGHAPCGSSTRLHSPDARAPIPSSQAAGLGVCVPRRVPGPGCGSRPSDVAEVGEACRLLRHPLRFHHDSAEALRPPPRPELARRTTRPGGMPGLRLPDGKNNDLHGVRRAASRTRSAPSRGRSAPRSTLTSDAPAGWTSATSHHGDGPPHSGHGPSEDADPRKSYPHLTHNPLATEVAKETRKRDCERDRPGRPSSSKSERCQAANRLQYDSPMRCLGCGYNLSSLTVERCPECGRTFDRLKPSTMQMVPVPGPRLAMLAWLGFALFALPVVLTAMDQAMRIAAIKPGTPPNSGAGLPGWVDVLRFASPVAMIAGASIAWAAAYRAEKGLRGPGSHWVHRRWCCWVALIPTLIIALTCVWGAPAQWLKQLLLWWLSP